MLINAEQGRIARITEDHGVYKNVKKDAVSTSTMNGPANAEKKYTSYNNQTGAQYSSYSFNTDGTIATGTSTSTTTDIQRPEENPLAAGPLMPTQKSAAPPKSPAKDEDPDDLEVESFVKPHELDGINVIWRVATESTGKQVIDAAAKLLIMVHHG